MRERAATRTAARALRFAPLAPRESELCCLEVELLSPYLPAGKATPAPTTRFDAARARTVRCLALRDCAGQPTSLVPTAEVQPSAGGVNDSEAPFSLTMRLAVPAAGAFTPAWPGKDAAREPPAAVLAPAGTWTHFAGDSLLRGVFSTLAQYMRQGRVEAWKGEAYFQSVFHMGRCLCCADVARPDTCAFSLHNESSPTLFAAARAGVAQGQACLSYSFVMDYAAIVAQMRHMCNGTTADERLPGRMVVSEGLHSMKHHNASFFKAEVVRFLDETATPRWRDTLVAVHTIAAPNYTMVAAAGHKQTPEAVSSFNAALREAVAAAAAARGPAEAPRLVDLHAVTTEQRGGALAAAARRRFPRLDALHFHDPFYQTAFVADALVLGAAARAREAAAKRPVH